MDGGLVAYPFSFSSSDPQHLHANFCETVVENISSDEGSPYKILVGDLRFGFWKQEQLGFCPLLDGT